MARPLVLSLYGSFMDVIEQQAILERIDSRFSLANACLTQSSGGVNDGYILLHWILDAHSTTEIDPFILIRQGLWRIHKVRNILIPS